MTRASFAAVIMFIFLLLTTHGKNRVTASIVFALFALVLYVPSGYYLELWLCAADASARTRRR